MIDTCLGWATGDTAASARSWRQLVDLAAQHRLVDRPELLARTVEALRTLAAAVPADERAAVAARMAGEGAPAALVHAAAGADPAEPELVLEAPSTNEPDQIRDLLGRIAAFQARADAPPVADGFAIVADAAGALRDGAGTVLPAQLGEAPLGVDGQAAGAWRDRVAIHDARLLLEGGDHAGEWRISADPLFDAAGAFAGYRGTARPPRPDERAEVAAAAPPADERFERAAFGLRGPLDMVVRAAGAEALPEGAPRAAAAALVERSMELADALDGFEQAVGAARGDEGGAIHLAGVLARLHAALTPLAEARGVALAFRIARDLPPIDADPQAVERMVTRLLSPVLALGRRGERMVVRLGRDRAGSGRAALSITRPGRLTGRDTRALLQPRAGDPAGAPAMALGFALRLVERLAGEAGGALTVLDDRLLLSLPLAEPARARRDG